MSFTIKKKRFYRQVILHWSDDLLWGASMWNLPYIILVFKIDLSYVQNYVNTSKYLLNKTHFVGMRAHWISSMIDKTKFIPKLRPSKTILLIKKIPVPDCLLNKIKQKRIAFKKYKKKPYSNQSWSLC